MHNFKQLPIREPLCLYVFGQAAKILANLIVMGSGILARAFVQAYRQALTSKYTFYSTPGFLSLSEVGQIASILLLLVSIVFGWLD